MRVLLGVLIALFALPAFSQQVGAQTAEQGYFGPGVRILLASILAVLLIVGGEWARRTERVSGLVGIASAHVPSILTAAGFRSATG